MLATKQLRGSLWGWLCLLLLVATGPRLWAQTPEEDCTSTDGVTSGEVFLNYGSFTNARTSRLRADMSIGQPMIGSAFNQRNSGDFGFYGRFLLPPLAPNLAATKGDLPDRVQLSWAMDPLSAEASRGFVVKRDGAFLAELDPGTAQFIDFNVQAGEFYEYSIAGINDFGEGFVGKSIGFINPNGVVSGRVTTRVGNPVAGTTVTLHPTVGRSLAFDGTGYVCLSHDDALMTAGEFTLSAWVRVEAGQDRAMIIDRGRSLNRNFWMTTNATGADAGVVVGLGGGSAATEIPVSFGGDDTGWHHVALVYAGGTAVVYVDGKFADSKPAPYQEIATAFRFGIDLNDANGFRGGLDDVKLYDRYLTQTELMTSKDITASSSTRNLIAYWKCDEGIGEKVFDISGDDIDGSLEGPGVGFSNSTPAVMNGAVTDNGGYYVIDGVNYAGAESFQARPQQNFYAHTALEFNAARKGIVTLPSLSVPDSATLELTVQPFSLTGRQSLLIRGNTLDFFVHMQEDKLYLSLNGESQELATLDQSFQHIALALDAVTNTVKTYRNGALASTVGFENVRLTDFPDAWTVGAYDDFGTTTDPFTGLIGELALFNTIVPEAQLLIHASTLSGDDVDSGVDAGDGSLVVYYPFDDGQGNVVENLGPDLSIGDGTVSNASFSIVDYRQETTPHEYRPGERLVNLNGSTTAVSNIDFTDESTVTISGVVRFSNTFCYQDSVELLVNGFPASPPILTDEDGRFVADFQPGIDVILTPRYVDSTHRFSPPFYEARNLSRPIAGVLYQNTTKRTVVGQVAGGDCRLPINNPGGPVPIQVKVASLNGCYESVLTIDNPEGNYRFANVPPVPVSVGVITTPAPYQVLVQNGGEETDLRQKVADTLDFIYTAKPQVELSAFTAPEGCNTPYIKSSWDDNVDARYTTDIRVFEEYLGQKCYLSDSFSLRITNEIADAAQFDTIVRDTNVFSYTYPAGLPNFNGDLTKRLEVVATNAAGANSESAAVSVVVLGRKSLEGSFTTTVPNWPIYVLRAPPGDQSSATIETGTTICQKNGGGLILSVGGTSELRANLTPYIETSIGAPGVENLTKIKPTLEIESSLEITYSADATGTYEVCTEFNRSVSTATGEDVPNISGARDVYIGMAANVLIGSDVFLKLDDNCDLRKDTMPRYNLDSYETEYFYSQWQLEQDVIPTLRASILERDQEAANEWERIIKGNRDDKTSGRLLKNYSFDGLVSIEEEIITNKTMNWLVVASIEITQENSVAIGATVNDVGSVLTLGITTGQTASIINETTRSDNHAISFTLADDDVGDNFTVDIIEGDVFPAPIFFLKAGESSCPWEPGTRNAEEVSLDIDKFNEVNVPATQAAEFNLTLENNGQLNDARVYILGVVEGSNPDGAVISIDGQALAVPRVFQIQPDESINLTMLVKRDGANVSAPYSFDSLGIFMASQCMYEQSLSLGYDLSNTAPLGVPDITMEGPYTREDLNKFYKEIRFNVGFIEPCTPIDISFPLQDWVITPADNEVQSITMTGYDSNDSDLEEVRLQYRRTGGDGGWTNISTLPAASFASHPVSRTEVWDMEDLVDGPYDVRAIALCTDPSLAPGISDVIRGRKETRPPAMLGTAEPADGILSPGDEISITFTKRINCDRIFPADGIGTNININNLALIDKTTGELIDATISCSDDKIIIVPNVANRFIENRTLGVVVNNIEDLYGNPSDSLHWEFFVNKSNLYWAGGSINERTEEGEPLIVSREIRNQGGERTSFTIPDVPNWMTVFPREGTLNPGERLVVNFEFPADLTANGYSTSLNMQTIDGSERLDIDLRVFCEAPNWGIRANDFQYSMGLTVELNIEGELSADTEDRIAAFVDGELRGIARIERFEELGSTENQYIAFLTVYSNDLTADQITFRIWDASECLIYGRTLESFPYEADEVIGVPLEPQTIHTDGDILKKIYFNSGWNWFSFNLDLPDSSVNGTMGTLTNADDNSVLRAQGGFAQYYPTLSAWFGSLTTTEAGPMYQTLLSAEDSITLIGSRIMNDRPLPISRGWNWVGYLPNRGLPTNAALNGLNSSDGDLIKSQMSFSQYVAGLGWVGSLRFLASPNGYLLRADAAGTLLYPDPDTVSLNSIVGLPPLSTSISGRAVSPAEVNAINAELMTLADAGEVQMELDTTPMHWIVNRTQYEHTMNVLAVVMEGGDREMLSAGDEIAAFVNGELRGADRVLYVPELDRYLMFLTVYGDVDGQTLEYQLYDRSEESVLDLDNGVSFGINSVVGTVANPYVFNLTTTGINTPVAALADDMRVYPNPSNGLVFVEFSSEVAGTVALRVQDVLGRRFTSGKIQVHPGPNQVQWDAQDAPNGLYFITIERDGLLSSRRVQIQR